MPLMLLVASYCLCEPPSFDGWRRRSFSPLSPINYFAAAAAVA